MIGLAMALRLESLKGTPVRPLPSTESTRDHYRRQSRRETITVDRVDERPLPVDRKGRPVDELGCLIERFKSGGQRFAVDDVQPLRRPSQRDVDVIGPTRGRR